MDDLTSIPPGFSISTVGTYTPKANQYMAYNVKGKPFGNKLRVGEIVFGSIVTIASENEAFVRLPIGTLSATLHGRLKPGDSLFFKVQEIQPSLVLRVHSVNVKTSGVTLDSREIIRMLDLPESSFYIEIIKFLRKYKTNINRSSALLLHQAYATLEESEIRKAPMQSVFHTLYFIQDNNIQMTANIYRKLLPSFTGMTYLENSLADLEKMISIFPAEFTERLKILFKKLRDGTQGPVSLMKFLTVNTNRDSLWSILQEFLLSSSDQDNQIRSLAEKLLSNIESRHLVNALSLTSNGTINVLIPAIINGIIHLTELTVKKVVQEKGNAASFYFAFSSDTSNLDAIRTQGFLHQNSLNATLISENKEVQEILKTNLEDLRKMLTYHSYKVQTLSVAGQSLPESDLPVDAMNQQQSRISIVI